MADKPPPSDREAERAVVSACLLSPDSLALVRDILQPDQLVDVSSRLVLTAAFELDDSGQRVDPVTLACHMRTSGALQNCGGTPALAALFDATPDPSHVAEHATIVAEKYRLRRIIDACKVHAVEAYGDIGKVDDYCARVERDILSATDPGSKTDGPQTLRELLKEEVPRITVRQHEPQAKRNSLATTTGIQELDHMLCGGMDPMMYILGGRPGQGKTALALRTLLAVAEAGKSGVFFSLEMPKQQLMLRLLSMASLVPFNTLKSGILNPQEWNSFIEATDRLSKLPISLHFKPGAHVSQVRSSLRREFARLRREYNTEPGFSAVDYAQLVKGDRPKGASRDEEVGSVSRACMALPNEFGCPLMLLAQLNREVEKRPNKRPQLSDLRESGSLEQDGYGIWFVYRDEYYNEDSQAKGIAEIHVAKNRNGDTGTIECKYDGPCVRFSSLNEKLFQDCDDLGAEIESYNGRR